ncbi:MAG: O-antigen ligase family protein [Mariprofundaceae bacterium]|nr:O-antigen ligase family protein [Mariprofundaceae bacterium]
MVRKNEAMARPGPAEKLTILLSEWHLIIVPLLLFPLMINLRIFPFVGPNEEPKWAVLIFCGLWMGAAACWMCWQRNQPLRLSFSLPGLLLLTFFLLLGAAVFIGPNMVEGAIRFSFWLLCAVVWLVSLWAMRHRKGWLDALSWAVSMGVAVFSLRYWWSYALDYGRPGYNVSVLFSPIGHVNFTCDVLIMLLPMLVWMLAVRSEPVLKVLNWFSVTTVTTVLLVASSRGALGGLAVGLLVLVPFLLRYAKRWIIPLRKKELWPVPLLWAGTALVAALIIYQSLPYHYRELARVSGAVQGSFESKGLTEGVEQPPFASFWQSLSPWLGERTYIYASATAMALDAPLLGQGTGNFAWIYPGYSNRFPDFRDSLSSERTFTTNPHNIVLQLATQNGIPATLIFLGLLGLFWYLLVRTLWRAWNGWCAAGVVAISAAIFDAMFNHVFFNPASMFTFALLGGSWWGYVCKPHATIKEALPVSWNRAVAITLLLATICLSVWPVRWLVSEWYVGMATVYIRQPAIAAVYYDRAYAWNAYNFRAVFGKAQTAYQQRRYADCIELLIHFERIYPYNPSALNLLGAAYMMSGRLSEAEIMFSRSIVILPDFQMAKQNLLRVRSAMRNGSVNRSR